MAENGSVWMNLLMDYMDKTHLEKINEIFTKYEEKIFATNYNFDEIKNLLKQYIPEMLDSDYKILENRLNNIRQTVLDKIREAENINLSAADFQDDFSSITEVNVIEKREKLLKAIESDITHDSPVGTEMFKEKNDAFYEHRSPYYAPTVNVSLFGDLLGLKKFIDTDINDKSWEGYIKERVKVIKFPIDSNIKVLEFGLHFTQNVYNITNNYDQIQKTNRDYTGRIYLSNLLEEDKHIECRLIIYNADNSPFKNSETSLGPEFYFKCFRKDGYIYLFCDQIEIFRLLPIWKEADVKPYINLNAPNNSYKFMPDGEEVVMIDPDGNDQNGIFSSSTHGLGSNGSMNWNGFATAESTVSGVNITTANGFQPMNILYRERYNERDNGPIKKKLSNFDLFVKNRYYLSTVNTPTTAAFYNADPKILGNLISHVGIYLHTGKYVFDKAASVANYMIVDKEDELNNLYNTLMGVGKSTKIGFLDPFPDQVPGTIITPSTVHYTVVKNSRISKNFGTSNDSFIISAGESPYLKSDKINYQFIQCLFLDSPNPYFLYREGKDNTRFQFIPIYSYYHHANFDMGYRKMYDFEVVEIMNSLMSWSIYKKAELEKERLKLDIWLEDATWIIKANLNDELVTKEDTFESVTVTPENSIITKTFDPASQGYKITPVAAGVVHMSFKAIKDSWIPTIKECLLTVRKYSTLTCDRMGFAVSASPDDEKNVQKINLTYTTFTFEYEIRDLDIIEFDKNTTTVKGLKVGETTLTIRVQEDGYALPEERVIAIKVLESTTQTGDTPINLTNEEIQTILNGVNPQTPHKGQYNYEIEMSEIQEILVEDDTKNILEELLGYTGMIDKNYNYFLINGSYRQKWNGSLVDQSNWEPKDYLGKAIRYENYLDWTPSTIEKMGDKFFIYGVKTDKTSYYKKPIGGFEKSILPDEKRLENYLFLNGRKIDVTAYPEYEGLYNAYKEAKYITEEGEAVDTYLEFDIPETTQEDPLVINRYQFQDIIIDSNANDFTITNDPANANFVTNAKLTDGRFGFKLTGANIGSQKVKISATSTAGKTVTKDIFVKCVEEASTYIDNHLEQVLINAVNGGANYKIVHFFTDAEYTGSNGNTFIASGQTNGVTISEWKDNGPILKKGPNGEELRDISFKVYYPFNAGHTFPQKQNITITVKNEVAKKKQNSYVVDLNITKETPSFGFLSPGNYVTNIQTCDENIYSWPNDLQIGKQQIVYFVDSMNSNNGLTEEEYDYHMEITAVKPEAIQVTKTDPWEVVLTPLQKGFNTVTWKLTKDDIVYKKTLQFRCKELTELTTDLEGDSINLWPAKNTTIEVTTNANDFTAEVEDTSKATVVKVNNQLSITSLDVGSTNLIIKAHADDAIQNTLTIPINVTAVPNTRLEVDATELTLDLGFNQRLTIDTEAEEWEYEILSGADYLNLVKTNDTTLVVQAVDIGESRIKIKAQHGELVESSVEIPVTVKYVTTELSIGNRTEYEILKDETLVFEIQTNADDFTYIEDTELVETPEPEAPTEGEDTDQVEQQPEQEIKKKRLKFTKGRGKLTVQGINPGNQKFSISATALNGDTKTIEVTIDVFEETTTFEITPESTKRRLKLGETQIFTINNSASDYTVIIPEEVKDCLTYDKSKHLLTCTKVCDTTLTFEAKEDGKKKIVKEVKVSANYPFAELNLTEDQLKTRVENLDQIFIELHKNKTNREEYNKTIDKLKNSFPEAEFTVDEESVPAFQLSENTKATLETYKTNDPTLDVYNNEIQEYYNAMPRSLNLILDDKTLARIHAVQTRNTNLQNTSYINTVRRHNLELNLLLTSDESWDWVDGSYKTDVYQRMGNCKVGLKTKTIGDSPSEEELLIHRQSLNAHLTKLRDNHRNYFTLKNYTEFKSNVIANNYALSPIVMLKGEILDEEGNPPEKLSGKSVRTFDTTPWVDKDYISEITMTNSNPDVVDVEVAENLKSITFTHKNNGKGESDVELTLKRVVEIHPTELTVDKDKLEFTLIAPPKKEETVTPEEGNPNPDGTEQPDGSDPVDQVPAEEETVVQESQTITFTTNAPTFTIEAEDPEQGIVDILIDTENPDVKAAKITPIKEGTIKLIAKATAVSEIPTTSYKEATVEINITVNPPVEEVVPPAPEVPTPDPSLPEGGDQTEQIPDQGETKEGEPTPQADESLDGGPTVDVDPDGGTEETPEVPEEPESKVETVEYTQTVNVRVMCLEDTNSKLVFDELFNKDKKFTLYKFDNSEATEDYVMNYNTVVLDNLMSIIDEYILDIRVPEYGRWKGQWPIYMLRPDVTLDVDETKTEEELLYEAYEKVQLSTLPEHIKKVYERNKATIKSINDFCQNVANKDNFLKENTLYRCVGFDATTNIPDSWAREHNLTLVNNVINRYKNEFTNASEIKYTGKLYHILATGTWDPIIVKKNRHQLMCIEICFKNLFPKHTEFKLLDSKDMKKINTKKVYANEVWFDHDDLGEDILPFGLDPEPVEITKDPNLVVGLDLQSVLEWIYLKRSCDDKVTLLDTSKKYRINMKYKASDFAYDVGGTDNNKKNVMVAVTRIIKSIIRNNFDQTQNEVRFDADVFEKITGAQATDIYFEDNYRIGVNNVGDLITWINAQKDQDMLYPYMSDRNIQAYRLDPRYINTPEGEKIYDTNGRKCFYSEDMGKTWKYSEEDVLPYGIDIEDGGWVSTRSLDENVIVLFSNVYHESIFRSYDGLHFEEIKVRNPVKDPLMHWNDVRINRDGTNIMCIDSFGNIYTSKDDDWTEFRVFADITRSGIEYDYRLMYPIDNHESRKGMGFLWASDSTFGLWFNNLRSNGTHILDAENRLYPRMKLGDRIQPNFSFDLKYINSDLGRAIKHFCVSKKVWESVLTTNNPLMDGQGCGVDLFKSNSTYLKSKFGIDFELLLSLSDTSVFSTDYQFEILDRGDILDLIEEKKEEMIKIDIKSSPIGFIQLDGFDFSGTKIDKTGPYILRKQFINFYTNIDKDMTRYVNKNAATMIKEIKDYIEDRISMSGYTRGLVQIQMTSMLPLQAQYTSTPGETHPNDGGDTTADPRRAELESQRKTYVNWSDDAPQNTAYQYLSDRSIDGIEFDILGVYSLDQSESSFVRYFKDLARGRNWISNLIRTMDDVKIWYDLDNEFLKKAFFPDDEKVKLSELVKDPFINMTDDNFFKHPFVIYVTIYPTDVQSFVNFRQKINRDLFNKYEKDGDIITTKTDVLFNKEEE